MEKIAIIVLTYGVRAHFLKNCLNSLLSQTRQFDGIFVFDNNSAEETKKLIQEYQNSHQLIKSFAFDKNLGSKAYSLALENIRKKNAFNWVMLMDDDGILKEDALANLIKSERFNESTAFLACKRIDKEGRVEKRERGWFNELRLEVKPVLDQDYQKASVEIGHCSYMGLLLNLKAVAKVGFPNRDFYLYLDDVEYSLRLGKYGKGYLIPSSVVVHDQPRSEREKVVAGIKRTRIEDIWRDYYGFRNYFLLRQSVKKPVLMLMAIYFRFVRSFLAIIFLDDNKDQRIKYLTKALRDGLGKKYGKLS